ncbi:MAG: HNH endonuclease [Akkermansiaceae bacterium]|nr:HNH endonuclease [Akkermansiaceae bacterium]
MAQFMSSMEWHWLQIFGPPHEYSEIDDWIGFRAWIFRKLCVDKQRTLLRAEVLSIIPEHLRAKRLTGSRHAKRFYRIGRRDGFLCSECGYSGKNLHLHEVIPIARGGKPVEDNQKILCRSCNSRRGASIPVEHSTPKIQSWKKWYEEMCRL